MNQLVIIGAGGFGREVLEWARDARGYRSEWEIRGFLDEEDDALSSFTDIFLPILGKPSTYEPKPDDVFICAIGQPAVRGTIRKRMESRGASFIRMIHESCIVGRDVDLSPGVILCPRVVMTCDISVGSNTAVNIGSAFGHDSVIGSDCQVSSFCDITGHVQVGNKVLLGSHASILPGKRIGDGSIVGAGSVVIQDVPPGVTVYGNPARVLVKHP